MYRMVFNLFCQIFSIFPPLVIHSSNSIGQTMATERKKSFSTEGGGFPGKHDHLQKQILFGQLMMGFRSKLWKLQEYFVYCKANKGSCGKSEQLLRKEDDSKVGEKKRREDL